ncbi:MAG: hypothetical protein LBK53_04365 [Heliobacteriaceae bacterium]|nr:hypothetical protein [Heliobacteriaceae bacterium]
MMINKINGSNTNIIKIFKANIKKQRQILQDWRTNTTALKTDEHKLLSGMGADNRPLGFVVDELGRTKADPYSLSQYVTPARKERYERAFNHYEFGEPL